jgi:hypothetical protein
MDVINDLLSKKTELIKQLDAIDTVLRLYGVDKNEPKTIPVAGSSIVSGFPVKESKENQIYWLFKNKFKKAVKLPDFQAGYEELCGMKKPINISIHVRNLKSEGKLVKVKYNGRHDMSYWGLPEWVDVTDYKSEFYPENDLINRSTAELEIK